MKYEYRNLQNAYSDSRASILRREGDWKGAYEGIVASAMGVDDPSVYTLSKQASILAQCGTSDAIDHAQYMMEEKVLPRARFTGESLAYSLKEAADVAITAGDFTSAKSYLDEGEGVCIKQGLHHTRRRIEQLRLKILLFDNPLR